MQKLLAGAVLLAFVVMPTSAFAATKKPTVSIDLPSKNASYDRTESMPIRVELENVTRTMVLVTDIKLVKEDTKSPSIGFVSGSGYQHTIYAGDTEYEFSHDWGLNSSIPGKYSIVAELHECNKQNCDWAPAGKLISKKSKKVTFTVRNDAGTTIESSEDTGTTVEITSPNGGEDYETGTGQKLSIKWVAEGVPKKSTICVTLEKRGSVGGMYAFPGDSSCKKVKDGKGSVTGKLLRQVGYDLAPGDYWARVTISAPPQGGKDGATLAQDISDSYFTLTD